AVRPQQYDARPGALRLRHDRERTGRLRDRQLVVRSGERLRWKGRTEDEAAAATLGHRFQDRVAHRVDGGRLDELHVVAGGAHAGAVQRVEQVGVALPAPRPAAFAALAVALDRAVVDLDHGDLARRLGFERAHGDDLV